MGPLWLPCCLCGDRVSCVAGDVREYEANEKVVNQTVADFGRLDCVIGNAGIWDYNLTLVNLPEEKLSSSFSEIFNINVLGYMMLAKVEIPYAIPLRIHGDWLPAGEIAMPVWN